MPALQEMVGTLGEIGLTLVVEISATLDVYAGEVYGVEVGAIFLEIIGTYNPVQCAIKGGAQQLQFL